jgi:hypothetical protein
MKIILLTLLAATILLSGCEGNLMVQDDNGATKFYRVTDCEVHTNGRLDYSMKGVSQPPLMPHLAICHIPQTARTDVIYEQLPGCCGQGGGER